MSEHEQAAQEPPLQLSWPKDDFYADSIAITSTGSLRINCGGKVIERTLKSWHHMAERYAEMSQHWDALLDFHQACESWMQQYHADDEIGRLWKRAEKIGEGKRLND